MVVVYGISNCDMVKEAIGWLKKNKIPHQFHNFKTEGISKEKLLEWINIVGLDLVINKRSTTWRNLSTALQRRMADPLEAVDIAIKETSIIKRPIIESKSGLLLGFNEGEYESKLRL